MNCPRCRDDLRQTQRMGVEIDFCPRCRGVWLDSGELERLLERSQDLDVYPDDRYSPERPPPMHSAPERRPPERPPQDRYPQERYPQDRYPQERYPGEAERPRRRDDDSDRLSYKKKKKKGFLSELIDLFD